MSVFNRAALHTRHRAKYVRVLTQRVNRSAPVSVVRTPWASVTNDD